MRLRAKPGEVSDDGEGQTGDEAGNRADALASFAEDIVLMRSVGMRPLVVHGGGPQIGELMARLGKVPEFVDGLRVTDAETLDIARMVLVGKVNRDIVSAINVHAPLAVGVSGEDAGLISAQARDPQLGFVGDVTAVNPDLLTRLLAEDLIPVVATIGSDPTGQAYNINADTAAGAIAEAVQATKLVYLTDVDGIRRDRFDPATRVSVAAHGRAATPCSRPARWRRDDPQGPLMRAGRPGRGGPSPHPRRPAAARPVARDLHPRRSGNHGHGERRRDGGQRMSGPGPTRLMSTYPPQLGHLRPGRRAAGSGTTPGASTSTSSRAWP